MLGSRHTADHYIADMKKMKFKYNIKEVMTNGNHVAIFYNIDMGEWRSLVQAGIK
ncbi:hypothetical protein KUH03_00555 [Sphingobacterium sp. E70]|uniref:hypothetical protein n=1 Tax=Sphingobacterium sp. E70 TaxID=2853439 RepID=UPI00211BF461|nr:hypothetical protein [Sphingobacterium sp. E70]ULT25542.1 hypothetical protein KUH03_00555 [Sphingobacterium sp. E70]